MKNTTILFFLSISLSIFSQQNLAIVENVNGVYVFTDCEPVAKYEIIGHISRNNPMSQVVVKGHIMSTPVISFEQHEEKKTELANDAARANRATEAIIITRETTADGAANIIKFADGETNTNLGLVKKINGVYVFIDCKPVGEYHYLGECTNNKSGDWRYDTIRDNLLKEMLKKYPEGDGIIMHYNTGKKDYCECIKFK